MNPSDEDLMVEYRDQNSMKAFRILFERYERPIFRYLNNKGSRLGNGIAEDLFQKTWLKIHEKRKSFDSDHKFSSWIYTIALNNLRDHVDLSAVKHEFSAEDLSYIVQPQADAETQLDAKLTLEKLNNLANELSPLQRNVLELVELEDIPIEEVARRLTISQDSVRQNLSRARKKLRQLIDEGEK